MKATNNPATLLLVLAGLTCFALAGFEPGDELKLTLRGINAAEQERVSGEYQVGETGMLHLPLLSEPVNVLGLSAEQSARAIEAAYRAEGVYTTPSIGVKPIKGAIQNNAPTVVSVGGQVRRAGQAAYHRGMTMIQAIDAVGGLNEFGGRNIYLLRDGKQYCLDFRKLRHKNIPLRPNDSLQVEQKGALRDVWKGKEEALKPLTE